MIDRNLVRGLFLAIIAAAFGIGSMQFSVGTFANPGPGLFPLLVSSLLLVLAISLVVQSRFAAPTPLQFNAGNIGLILLGLIGFVVLSDWVNMIAGIAAMVFTVSLAGTSYSFWRSLQITVGLIVVAVAFESLLGVKLGIY